jgi:hypothetical protein
MGVPIHVFRLLVLTKKQHKFLTQKPLLPEKPPSEIVASLLRKDAVKGVCHLSQ